MALLFETFSSVKAHNDTGIQDTRELSSNNSGQLIPETEFCYSNVADTSEDETEKKKAAKQGR